jgi:hypothetical protein
VQVIDEQSLRAVLEADGEFRRAARLWTGSFAFRTDDGAGVRIELRDGRVVGVEVPGSGPATVAFSGPADGWANVFAPAPPPYYQDLIGGAVGRHGFGVEGDLTAMAAHYGAIARAVVLVGRVLHEGAPA